ncbi:LOW QUALITY PROTEIN: extracellular matrix protein FRAS1 [Tachyglossus aculeatus]|uniref:LOW QUALITY PROTEIN: extracellular matrix protein FRAS1 n=1 Tax=Tachyglossus aculeatus TaxID=9261 RepID=UPI0018F70980|nr:LOW QUALITY PROTEIN: extracellular matrix protein FRAS1 [Tachyglossus aculeatus]
MGGLPLWLGAALAWAAGLGGPPPRSEAACVHRGFRFESAAVWKSDSCQECRCHGELVLCKPVLCRDPGCDTEKGEVLQIGPGQCCPECVSRLQGSCRHEGEVHAHGTEWPSWPCGVCWCTNGTVRCRREPCPALFCGPGTVARVPEGGCCPQCLGTGESCLLDGRPLQDGEERQLSRCARCVCQNGTSQCFSAQCPSLLCPQGEKAVRLSGHCCPRCLPRTCVTAAGTERQHGEQWAEGPCVTCQCVGGETRCRRAACVPQACDQGQSPGQRPGKCCEHCQPSEGACWSDGALRSPGELWAGPACDFCSCERGRVTCQPVECARGDCAQGEERIHLAGKCCPECLPRRRHCAYEEVTEVGSAQLTVSDLSDARHIPEGETGHLGSCQICECQDTQVICYQPSCPPCTVGTWAMARTGHCCPECTAVPCHSSCLACSRSPEYCDRCRDAAKLLQDGRCVATCHPGFYQEGGACLACQKDCLTCTSGFQCSSCPDSRLLKEGRCVATCGDGFYQHHRSCAVCHRSCAACRGPTGKDCLACRDRARVLKAHACESRCGRGFYRQDGVCIACDSSCESCGPDSPLCLSCAGSAVMHGGKCLAECPGGHYPDATRRCQACHISCAGCTGPSATHCTLCSPSLALYQGRCLPGCGASFYSQNGICQACHPSCLSCMGPGPSDCTRCWNPEEGLQAERHLRETPVGTCLSRCKPQFYLKDTGFCEACDGSCGACVGSSPHNCTACASTHVLLDGRCLAHCPPGFFRQEVACSACHPTCRECHAGSDSDCTACHPHAALSGGTCRNGCRDGQYLDLVGSCAGCHPLCQHCTADPRHRGSLCLRCQSARHVLLGDGCVPTCPAGYYTGRGACTKCHPSCKSCRGEGPASCSSCDEALVLSHTGRCVTACHPGYYLDEGRTCQVCDSLCRSCDSPTSCTSCRDPAQVLLRGKCLDSCGQQYFLDVATRTCKECHRSCSACHGPLGTDCLQCGSGQALQDGTCVPHCSPAFYRDSDTCSSCDEGCLRCCGPRRCSLCEAPFLLQEGVCVPQCQQGRFPDLTRKACTACPPQCLQCDREEQCLVCSGSTLLQEGRCVTSCGPGFYPHPQSGACQGNAHPPVLRANGSLVLGAGSTRPLDPSLLDVHDPDGGVADLLFQVLRPPTNGRLLLRRAGAERRLLPGSDPFTWDDLREQSVLFVHSPEMPRRGHFSLRVSDGQFSSEPERIDTLAFSTQGPYVLRNEALRLGPGETGAISPQLLDVRDDDDHPRDVVVEVVDPPAHGRLSLSPGPAGVPVRQLRLDELAAGHLRYAHDGSDGPADAFLLQAGDGHSFCNILLRVRIAPEDGGSESSGARLLANSVAWVPGGGLLPITRQILRAEVPGARPSEIVYVVTRDHPEFGEVVLLPTLPADGPADGTDGEGAPIPATTFTQQDIDDGSVWYRLSGAPAKAQEDSFRFEVSSPARRPQSHAKSHVFRIGILPQTPGAPQLSSGSSLHMEVREDRVTVIQPRSLSFEDSDSPSGEIVYHVTKPLPPNQGSVEYRDRPYSPAQSFTQADVDEGKVVYRPPPAAPHLQELMAFSFAGLPESLTLNFTVSDGEHTTPEMALTLHLLPTNGQPPGLQITAPVLEVEQGDRAPLGIQLAGSEAELAPGELVFELVKPPLHGGLLKYAAGFQGPMEAGDTFTYEDVVRQAVLYGHDGSSAPEDSLEISITGGLTRATTVVRVHVSVPGSGSPRLAAGSTLTITVATRSSVVLTRAHLAYEAGSSPDSEVRIQCAAVPLLGTLTRTAGLEVEELSEASSFTMEDVNSHSIRYWTGFETDGHPATDSFRFSVAAALGHLDDQVLTITIVPGRKQPPILTFADLITVDEGGRAPLTFHHFFATDSDPIPDGVAVTICSAPKFGCIENTRTGGRFGPEGSGGRLGSFLVRDIQEHHVYYFQSVHELTEPTHDAFSFYVSNGSLQAKIHTVNITIQRKSDRSPRLTLQPVQVWTSSGALIQNTSITLKDLDTPDDQLMFLLTREPEHGRLRRKEQQAGALADGRVLSQGSSFTYRDVVDGLLGYTPDLPAASADEFHFSVTDGLHTETGRMEIHLHLPESQLLHLTRNQALQLPAGSTARITERHLHVADKDSGGLRVRYVVKKDPGVGHLQMTQRGQPVYVSALGPVRSFTQADVSNGLVEYSHPGGESGGEFGFQFDVVNGEGSEGGRLVDQYFTIRVLEDNLPPSITANEGLVLDENSVKTITTLQLSATDRDSGPEKLRYRVTQQPQLGHLEHSASPGTPISSFTQADLASWGVQYNHTSTAETHADAFSFTVSDGTNEVGQTFHISINPVDDSLPVVTSPGMRVQEGLRKIISEFELKATDADTEAGSVTFTVVQPPRHGTIDRVSDGQLPRRTATFTMEDIYQSRVSYRHDGSDSLRDRFTFTVSDGTNPFFRVEEGGKEIVTAAPQKFRVDILPIDDGTPRIITNLGLQWLEYMDGKASNLITKKELLTVDPDTEDQKLVYEITSSPRHGSLRHGLQPGAAVTTFTQEDVNLGLLRYVLRDEKIQETMDSFQFLVKDSLPNVVSDNTFHIQWSLISFKHTSYNVSEKAGSVSVTVERTGNLNQYAIVLCHSKQGTATSTSSPGSKPGQPDFVEYAGQVQFDEREDTKSCTIVINDDEVFENIESFTVELSMPAYALLGAVTHAEVNINDTEDEPTLQFDRKTYKVNESAGVLLVPVERSGDSSSVVSAICYTVPKSAKGSSLYALETGSDFKSRGLSEASRVVLGPGVTLAACEVVLIDDSEYEEEEEFEVVLAGPSANARVGPASSATVIISGPNDASTVALGNTAFTVSEDAGLIEIPVVRRGTDLSTSASVWCATRPSDPPSATPGVDYIPSSRKVEFRAGDTERSCPLTILDDAQKPAIEGLETFVVFLSSAQGAELSKPSQAVIAINDTFQDVPSMQFGRDSYPVREKDGAVHIPVLRSGDLNYESSVRCLTLSQTARVAEDFEGRSDADSARITFLKGEKVKNCTVYINDDSMFEPEERFTVSLGHPLGNHWSGARIGKNSVATVTISNEEDAPTIEFEEAAYQVREPPGPEAVAVLSVGVIRRGDLNRTSKIRCSTRDGSAQSGLDYYPKSRILKFGPGEARNVFKVEIMSNEDREWHESFSLVLGPDEPVEAVLGDVATATVTILDQEAAGSLILPAPPIVVSLADYDHVDEVTKEGAKKSPSPGYPLVCVTPCDPHYPQFALTKERCGEAGINQSSVRFSWEVAAPTDSSGARSPFEAVTDNTPFTGVNHVVLDSIYFSRRFHVRCVAKAVDKAGHVGTPLRSPAVTIGTDSALCHTPVVAGTARGFQAQSFIATLKYLDVKHKEHPNRIHISVQIPHQDGMLPLISTMPLHNLHFLLSESIYRHQHVCSNLNTARDPKGTSGAGFLGEGETGSGLALGPGYDRPYQLDPRVREPKTVQLYKHLNLKSCTWTFDAYYDMTELIDVCGGSVTADFQVRDSAQSFLTVHVPLHVSYIYVTAPRGWASLEHHTEMEFSFFYDTVLWRTGIQTDSVLSARLQIVRIYIREDGRLVIEFKTHAKFRGHFVMEHHTLPDVKSFLMAPDHLGGMEFALQLLWSAQTFDSPSQLWRATSSYNRKDYSGEYTIFLIPCTVQPTQPWIDPGDKPLACTAHAPERFLIPIAFQQTSRPVPVVYSLNTEFQLCNNEKVFLMDPSTPDVSLAEMDYKGAFSKGQTLYGRVLWNPDQNLNSAYRLRLEKVYLCTGKDGHVPFFDPMGTVYNEGPQYGCIQPNKHLKHRFLLLDRSQPEVTDKYFQDVPFDAHFASDLADFHLVSSMPGVDGFTLKVDALYKVEAGHQWYLQVIYIIGPDSRTQRSFTSPLRRSRRDLLDDSLIYNNEGDQVKNGTNMKALSLDGPEAGAASTAAQTGASVGSAVAAALLLLLLLLGGCCLTKRNRRPRRKGPDGPGPEDYPLNSKMDVPKRNPEPGEKNAGRHFCTVRNVNLLRENEALHKVRGVKVKQVNLEVKVHNNLQDGTEV